jgi:patatin-like phospholipase/acyl hydrolase
MNGGGAKGLIALHQVEALHNIQKVDFFRNYTYMAGTSTGALCVALFAAGYTPTQAIEIYRLHLQSIFDGGFLRRLRGLSKYSNENLIEIANKYLGSIELGDLKQNILIPALRISDNKTKIFKSFKEADKRYKLVDVIVASAAAPTFFPSHNVGGQEYTDGGLSHNNPSDVLVKECLTAANNIGEKHSINLLSITTGEEKIKQTNADKKGSLFAVPNMISRMLQQQDKKTHEDMSYDFDPKNKIVNGQYIRCESKLMHSSGEIDDVTNKNIQNMINDGIYSASLNKKSLYLHNSKV